LCLEGPPGIRAALPNSGKIRKLWLAADPGRNIMPQTAQQIEHILSIVDVRTDGARPWDIHVHDERFFARVLRDGVLGLGESYMDGWWDAERIDELFARIVTLDPSRVPIPLGVKWQYLTDRVFNRQRKSKAFRIADRHYNLGNDLFKAMLDRRMTYSCAYWQDAVTLDDAQEAKLALICRKLDLEPGQTVLDIGCGWGSFLKYAAEKHDVRGVGITVASEQVQLGRELCAGLPIELRVQDYRDVTDTFDRVVSVGMLEHVGPRNYRTFFEVVNRCLSDNGLFLLHTIGSHGRSQHVDAWTAKYIFPDHTLPAIREIGRAIERLFVMEDWHNFGAYYDQTLLAWFANFDAAWPRLRPAYGDAFYRMWKYYLQSCAGSFRARRNNVWQIVLAKRGVRGGYRWVR
jgi:cyclopropane-fatty-acyl-phospholipid synthase